MYEGGEQHFINKWDGYVYLKHGGCMNENFCVPHFLHYTNVKNMQPWIGYIQMARPYKNSEHAESTFIVNKEFN